MEHEITGHARKVYKVWKNPGMSFWKKFKEIGVEVLIIVFAVSLAAFLEREREHSKDQEQVKEFLQGLKTDLQSDITEMGNDKKSYEGCAVTYTYLISLKPGQVPDTAFLRKHYRYIFNTTGLIVNDGRYQGFKSSGRISTIENTQLQNDILDLYQEDIPILLTSTNAYSASKEMLFRYLFDEVKRNPDGRTSNIAQVLATEKAHNICIMLASTEETLSRYDSAINKSRKIIGEIDHQYK